MWEDLTNRFASGSGHVGRMHRDQRNLAGERTNSRPLHGLNTEYGVGVGALIIHFIGICA